jgi:hypothetical protein
MKKQAETKNFHVSGLIDMYMSLFLLIKPDIYYFKQSICYFVTYTLMTFAMCLYLLILY